MRKFWKQLRVVTLIASLSLTMAAPVFATEKVESGGDCVEPNAITFEDLIVSSLSAGLPLPIVAAVQKVREAVSR